MGCIFSSITRKTTTTTPTRKKMISKMGEDDKNVEYQKEYPGFEYIGVIVSFRMIIVVVCSSFVKGVLKP